MSKKNSKTYFDWMINVNQIKENRTEREIKKALDKVYRRGRRKR